MESRSLLVICQSPRTVPMGSVKGVEAKLFVMVWLAGSRLPTRTPPNSSRYSKAPNHQALSLTSGPPRVPAYCCRRNGGVSPAAAEVSKMAGKRLGNLFPSQKDTQTCTIFLPDLGNP